MRELLEVVDAMAGDATLFARQDSVEQAWAWVTPILESLDSGQGGPLHPYPLGSAGPQQASALLSRDGRRWKELKG